MRCIQQTRCRYTKHNQIHKNAMWIHKRVAKTKALKNFHCENWMQRFRFACFRFCNAFIRLLQRFCFACFRFCRLFAGRLCIWLCFVYLQRVCWMQRMRCQINEDVFLICLCFVYLHVFLIWSAFEHVGHRITLPATAAAKPRPSQDASQNPDNPSSTQTAGNNDDQTLLLEQKHNDEVPTTETGEGDAREKAPFTETDPGFWPEHVDDQQIGIVRSGPIQIEEFNFPQSQSHRRFTKDKFFMKITNLEKIPRSWLRSRPGVVIGRTGRVPGFTFGPVEDYLFFYICHVSLASLKVGYTHSAFWHLSLCMGWTMWGSSPLPNRVDWAGP